MDHKARLALALQSLLGLSQGDSFGETFFGPEAEIRERLATRTILSKPWHFTDDTVMSIAVFKTLETHGEINQDALAQLFVRNYLLDDQRGYGGTAHGILRRMAAGEHWSAVSSSVFDGMGSMGNGAAMRAGVIGAYFHDDVPALIMNAERSAVITHTHPEAIAGAIAVALATAYCASTPAPTATGLFNFVITHTPDSDVRSKIKKATTLPASYDIRTIVAALGNGTQLSAPDTVPLTIWCAAHHLADINEALWTTVSALGDRDTTCAIVGGIVALSTQVPVTSARAPRTEPVGVTPFWK